MFCGESLVGLRVLFSFNFSVNTNLVFEMDSPIECLSGDVLLENFKYLDAKSLKSVALVCKE